MVYFFIDKILVTFGRRVFQQTVCIPVETNYALLLADLFFYYYEADFIQKLLMKKDKKLAISLNFTFRYIVNVLQLNNSKFGDYVERIYPIELEIKKHTAYTVKSASYVTYI